MIIQHTHTNKGGSFYIGEPSAPTAQLVYHMAGEQEQTKGLPAKRENIMIIDHTEVKEVHKGEGIGTHLVTEAVNYARQHQMKILPLCSFARSIMKHNEEYQDLLLTVDNH